MDHRACVAGAEGSGTGQGGIPAAHAGKRGRSGAGGTGLAGGVVGADGGGAAVDARGKAREMVAEGVGSGDVGKRLSALFAGMARSYKSKSPSP